MEEPLARQRIEQLECSLGDYRQKYEDKCRKIAELESKNRVLDKAITDLTKIIKDQKKELTDLRIVNKLEKDREIAKRLRTNNRLGGKKFVCTFSGCDYFTDVQEDYDFHINVHNMATLKCPYCMYLSFNFRDLRRHVTSSTKHCRFMYRCQYCKNTPPFATNDEAQFRTHIQKHFRNEIDNDRMDFLIESIHSASQITVWSALNTMYKVYDINDNNENTVSPKIPSKRLKVDSNKSLQTKIERLPMIDEAQNSEYWPSLTLNEQTNVEIVPETANNIFTQNSDHLNSNEAVSMNVSDIFQESTSNNISDLLEKSQTTQLIQENTAKTSSDLSYQDKTDNDESLIHSNQTLQQELQFSDLNFPLGSDIILYFPDESGDIDETELGSQQVCVIQHISVQDDGLTHVTLEPSLLPDSFVPKDAQIFPAEISDSIL